MCKLLISHGSCVSVHDVLATNMICPYLLSFSIVVHPYSHVSLKIRLHKNRCAPMIQTQSGPSKVAYVPVLNVVEADYALHTEVTFALQEIGVTENSLIFRDQIDMVGLHDNQQLTVTLVDHHTMSPGDCSLEGIVREVIDHRPQVKEFRSR